MKKEIKGLYAWICKRIKMKSPLRYIEVLVWPIAAIVLVLLIRPQLRELLTGAKIKVEIFGVSIDTTIPELQKTINRHFGKLEANQWEYLNKIYKVAQEEYPTGVPCPEKSQLVRPLRNSGLVRTIPRDTSLGTCKAIRITDLGEFLMNHKYLEPNKVVADHH